MVPRKTADGRAMRAAFRTGAARSVALRAVFAPLLAAVLLAVLLLPAPAGAEEGEADPIILGMSAAFSGPSRGLGIEFYRGIMAYLNHINSGGGINGHPVEILPLDDGYNPKPCVRNTVELIQDRDVFALFSYVGTPTTTRVLPLLKRYRDRHAFLLFPFTGAEVLRTPPYSSFVFNLRASYFEETGGLVNHFADQGRDRIAVFYQADAYGRTGWDGVRRALRARGLEITGEAAYRRGATFDHDFHREVEILKAEKPDAVICIGSYAGGAAFIRDARDNGLDVPIANVSFADVDNMVGILKHHGEATGRDYLENLVCSQVVPSYEDVTLPGVRLYRMLMAASTDILPPRGLLHGESYVPHRMSLVGLEGFLNAVLVCEMIRRMGDDVRRERIHEVMCSIRDFDLGIGTNVRFGPNRNQGLDTVYYTTVEDGRIVPMRDWTRWAKP